MTSVRTGEAGASATVVAAGLSKTFGSREAVYDLSFSVGQGRAFGLLGPNGAGKTTTVRLLTGLIGPTRGEITLFGERLTRGNADALRARIGVQTDTNLYESLSAKDNLRTWGELYGLGARDVARRTADVLEVMDLSDRADSLVGELSKGMRQKLSVARAVLHEPELLFLDEPTAGLDPEAAEELIAYLTEMIRAMRTTVIICTHQLHGLEQLVSDVGILHRGRLAVAGTVDDLLRRRWPLHRYSVAVAERRDRAAAIVSGLVSSVEDGAPDSRVDFAVEDRATVSAVVAALVADGIPVRAVVPRDPTLRDLYFATLEQRDAS